MLKIERCSDITLGDNWGTEFVDELKGGVPLVICNTDRGLSIVNNAELELRKVDIDVAKNANGQLLHPSKIHEKRKDFLTCAE